MLYKIDKNIRILVVDDYPDLRRMMIRMLHRAGFGPVQEAGDGYECMRIAEADWLDVVLLDISMPGVSGMEICPWLRKAGRNSAMRIIACTAYAQQVHRPLFRAAGFDDLLIKPFGADELYDAVTTTRPQRPAGRPR